MALASGLRLGPYEIVAPIGAGGMGEVWRAVDTRLGRPVAIKVLPASVAEDRGRLARFAREAKLLAALRHPGIATIHSFEEVDGETLLVMELAEGEGLDAVIARGPIPLEEALAIARRIAEALEEAHEQGIVHRDLKPANVKVAGDGGVKLLDFGLAKAMGGDAGTSGPALSISPTVEGSPTAAGVILGTAPYMAPEQARGRPVDRRADIWAFGVVLSEMLTGKRLFTGPSASDVLANVLKQPIDLEALPRETPPPVRRLLKRCLERDPRRRLRDVGEARVLLEDLPSFEPETAPLAQAPARSITARVIAVAASAAAAGALAAWLARPAPPRPALRAVSFPVERLSAEGAHTPVVSRDGTRVLYTADRRVRVLSLDDPLAAPVEIAALAAGPGPSAIAFWSHDGAHVAVSMERKLWRFPAGGGAASLICDLPESGQILGGDWGPDGHIVFAAWRGNLYRVAAGGGKPEELLRRDPKTEVDFHFPRLLPQGRGMIFVAHRYDEEPRRLDLLADGRRTTLLDDGVPIAHPSFAGERILYNHLNRDGIWEVGFSLSARATTGRPRLLLRDGTGPSLSTDGTLVFVRGMAAPASDLVWVSRDGNLVGTIGSPVRGLKTPALSPDGTRVVFSSRTDQRDDLSLFDLVRGTPARLTRTPDRDENFPSWTPSGDRILFGQGRNFDLLLRSVETSGVAEPRDVGDSLKTIRGALEPDGRHMITMTDDGSGKAAVWRVRVDADLQPAGEPLAISRAGIWWSGLAIAPQGDLVAYAAAEGENVEIFLSQLGGERRWQVSSATGQHPTWSRAGDRLFYIAGDDLMEVDVHRGTSLSLSAPRRLFSLADRRLGPSGFDVASDGRFLMVRQGEAPRVVVVVNGDSLLERPAR